MNASALKHRPPAPLEAIESVQRRISWVTREEIQGVGLARYYPLPQGVRVRIETVTNLGIHDNPHAIRALSVELTFIPTSAAGKDTHPGKLRGDDVLRGIKVDQRQRAKESPSTHDIGMTWHIRQGDSHIQTYRAALEEAIRRRNMRLPPRQNIVDTRFKRASEYQTLCPIHAVVQNKNNAPSKDVSVITVEGARRGNQQPPSHGTH